MQQEIDEFAGSKIKPGPRSVPELKLLLDVMMPNGKMIRHCTGNDVGYLKHIPSGVSQLCALLADQLAPDELVGSRFAEPDIRAMWDGAYMN